MAVEKDAKKVEEKVIVARKLPYRHPHTKQVFKVDVPVKVAYDGWVQAQVQAGLLEEYK